MKKPAILFIVTSHGNMGDDSEPTGVWLEELTTPYYAFVDAGYAVTIASVNGGDIPIDPRSLEEEMKTQASVKRYFEDSTLPQMLCNTPAASDVQTEDFAVVFFPGGHGTMWDYPNNPVLANIIRATLDDHRIVASVCHGPAVLVGVNDDQGQPLVKGKRISAFTDSEEEAVGLTNVVPFLLESRLRELGAQMVITDNFAPLSAVDIVMNGYLVTGQNPPSAELVALDVIRLLETKSHIKTTSDSASLLNQLV